MGVGVPKMIRLAFLMPTSPGEWELFLLNTANALLGLIVGGIFLFIVVEVVLELIWRHRTLRL